MRVSAPTTGDALPVIIFSHGHGQSLYAYGPLTDYWAAHGFVVIQPTHLDSRMLGLAPDDSRRPRFWRFREDDLATILDGLDHIETESLTIRGRLDRSRIAVAGHSWGGQTASTLLGATHPDPDNGSVVNRKDTRIKAGVLLGVPGSGNDLTEHAARTFPFMYPDFSTMTAPTLIVVGDHDIGRLSTRGAGWWRDAYDLSPSPKALLNVFGGEHALGGIPGYEARETTDERPERVAAIQHFSTAFLYSALYPGDPAWLDAVAALAAHGAPEGSIEMK
ncbi:chlorophyllase [Rhizobiaceae bacterium n13]|uniref:Chlorophyllase n=1 Tax=Ferirhizobium litorale TaxID=2927786 RepID=A0AAE3QIP7_9HYPH|nr:chlorophyllase [Fererhizobium litorale]MDI7864197.1 chlorophyllase [Fererhizobium litorale]MDI7923808.1 chlorophyllase [Fererhizobium litorale]